MRNGSIIRRHQDCRPSGCNLVPALLRILCAMARTGEALAVIPLETRHFEDLGRFLLGG